MTEEVKSQEEAVDTTATPAKPAEPKKLTKEQQKQQDRMREMMAKVNARADLQYRQLQDRFMDFFMASDNPEGDAVQQKIKQLSSQWKIYCASKNLRPEIFDSIKKYCDKIVEEFKQGMV